MTNNETKMAYYARPISLYGTKQEERDIALIERMGYEAIQINKKEIQSRVAAEGMEVFLPLVQQASALFFRGFLGGAIGAGVAKEIAWAEEAGIPVLEIPSGIGMRTLTVEATRDCLKELGAR